MTRVALFGPLERMKIILQTKHMGKYANPKSDMPVGVADLIGKISSNQGLSAFYRGQTALLVTLGWHQLFKFYLLKELNTLIKDSSVLPSNASEL